MLVERLAARWQAVWTLESKFASRLARGEQNGRRLVLCQPQTYMNQSGDAVGKLIEYFRVPRDRLLVAVDDADLPLGEIRLRPRGTSGGHRGLETIEQPLDNPEYGRVSVGIGGGAGIAGWSRSSSGWTAGIMRGCASGLAGRKTARARSPGMCWEGSGATKQVCWTRFWTGQPGRWNAGRAT